MRKGVIVLLCQFTFRNFKSYRDQTVFDLQAADIKEFSDSLLRPGNDKFSPLLPVSVIYGPNSGGKSGVLEALSCLISRILLPIKATGKALNPLSSYRKTYRPFLFDDASASRPTEFQLFFRTEQAEYEYTLWLHEDEIVYELLRRVKLDCQRRYPVTLFERDGEKITPGSALKRVNVEQINSTLPFLSFLAINYHIPEIDDAISFFDHSCFINYAIGKRDQTFRFSSQQSPREKDLFLTILQGMDIPVSDFRVEEKEPPEHEGGTPKEIRIFTTHQLGDKAYQLPLSEESQGTVKVFSFLPAVVFSLLHGGLLIVDELDAKLHPQLLRFLIELYTNPDINLRSAQLIFTSHDLSTMKSDLLRRDEIWFAARNQDSASELWSLYDLRDEHGAHIKTTAAYDKQYLAGRYGADPYLRKMLDWRETDEP